MTREELKERVLELTALGDKAPRETARAVFTRLRSALGRGDVRAAECVNGQWRVHEWVRQGILLGFRFGDNRDAPESGCVQARDRDTLPLKPLADFDARCRIVPGGSAIRDGAFVGRGVVCMPPMYINIGAYVDDESMIDSHALVGSCAQVGRRCHISAAAQLGGVLEPPGAWPVIIEDEALVGAGVSVVEGVIVGRGAILGAGVILTSSTPVYDLVDRAIYRAADGQPLRIPPMAVVVPGSRPARGDFAREHNLHVATPLIVKYRDRASGDSMIEDLLR